MKRFSHLAILSFFLLIWGCSKDNPVIPPDNEKSGSLILKIDRENAPLSVTTVTAKLIRSGYETITGEMNLHSDSTADLALNNIAAGIWLLKVDAKNSSGFTEYAGETNVTIITDQVIQVYLTLYPISGNTGGIQIFVSWGPRWKDFVNNPVLTPMQNPSNPNGVSQSKVIYENGVYKMWYNAVYNSAVASVWYAESPDGRNWTTIGNSPVLSPGSIGSWDSYSVVATEVIKDGNLYKMYYLGWNTHPYQTTWKTGLATSEDGIHWSKYPTPVFEDSGPYHRTGITAVVKHNDQYFAYFGYGNSSFTEYSIGVATSSDGIIWIPYTQNPILVSNFPWETTGGIYYPTVRIENNKFKMYYQDRACTAFGYAESQDGIHFIKDSRPIFTRAQLIHHWLQISYPCYLRVENQYRIYFTGGNSDYGFSICLLER